MTNTFNGLPRNWTIKISKTHQSEYFYNKETQQSSWEPPSGTNLEALGEYIKKRLHDPEQVRCAHLLVKHKNSRKPSSWKEPQITRTKEEAIEKLRGFQKQILDGSATLGQLAATESDCSSHARNGDLGLFGRKTMHPSFERAAFALQVGEISDIVESDSGVHLIERLG
ncbi:hypothetical protein LJB42_001216 [Komagataella kurtzmanii]|nr:hypothetical protein LJB42_001216 [Komagataella kurtzmanii]